MPQRTSGYVIDPISIICPENTCAPRSTRLVDIFTKTQTIFDPFCGENIEFLDEFVLKKLISESHLTGLLDGYTKIIGILLKPTCISMARLI